MTKATRNYLTFAAMALLGLIQLVSGFVLWQVLPGGYRGGGGGGTFLWSRETWIDIHAWSALVLIAIVILHIILHWGWIVRLTKSYFKRN
jgi:cytochrome b subunit of formate dehydrogenase